MTGVFTCMQTIKIQPTKPTVANEGLSNPAGSGIHWKWIGIGITYLMSNQSMYFDAVFLGTYTL